MDESVLWQAYESECKSHIDDIDDFLQSIESDIGSQGFFKGEVSTVFRAYHSLKGTSAGMGVESVSKLAHACEDILGLVRDHDAQLDEVSYALLYGAIDVIRDSVDAAVAAKANPEYPEALIEKLKSDYARVNGGESSAGASDANASAGSSEEDDMFAVYCETAGEGLIKIYDILSSDDPSEHVEEFFDTVDILSQGAIALDMEMVSESFTELQNYLEDPKEALNFFLTNIITNFEIIYEMAGLEIPTFGNANVQILSNIKDKIELTLSSVMVHGKVVENDDVIKEFLRQNISLTYDLGANITNSDYPEFNKALNIIPDLMQRMLNDQFPTKTEIISTFPKILQLVDWVIDGNQGSDSFENTLDELSNIVNFILDPTGEDVEDIIEVFDLDVIYRSVLSAEQIYDIFTRVKDGYKLYGFEVFLDRDKNLGQDILKWLKEDIDMINNKTIFGDGETGFEFLLLTKHNVEKLEKEILGLDKERKLINALIYYPPNKPADAHSLSMNNDAISHGSKKEHVLRISLSRIEQIMDLVQGVTQHLNSIEEAASYLNVAVDNQNTESVQKYDESQGYNPYLDALRTGKLNKIILNEIALASNRLHNIYETCLNMSLMPVQQLLQRIPRTAKMLSEDLGKKVSVMINSDPLNVDNSVYEVLNESLVHLVRNAIDHAIEMPEERVMAGKTEIGRIKIEIKSMGEELNVTISDDGRGINHEKVRDKAIASGALTKEQASEMSKDELVRLILRPSFSTADTVSEISGRGVGMDVVNSNIIFLGGSIRIVTEVGQGSQFILRVPLQSMIQRLILFEAGGILFSLPEIFVNQIIHHINEEEWVHNKFANINDEYIKVYDLKRILQIGDNNSVKDNSAINQVAIVTKTADRSVVLLVDKVIGHREIFLEKSNNFFNELPFIQRAAVVSSTEVPLVLNIFNILDYKEQD